MNLANWFKANKISLNVARTELVLLTSPKKQLESDLELKKNGKRLNETDSIKYLGFQIEEILTWKQHVNHVSIKLKKANVMLSKLRHVSNKINLKSDYYAIF